jgi:HSP20 family protein
MTNVTNIATRNEDKATVQQSTVQQSTVQKSLPSREVRPRVDVYENSDEVLLLADMPGATPDSVNIRLESSLLSVQSQRAGSDGQAVRYHRAFQVPDTVDPEKISAELKNGVLQVHLRKSERAKPRNIAIRAQ